MSGGERPSPRETLRLALAAMLAGDLDVLRRLCDPDVIWHVPGQSQLAGELRGIDAVVERVGRMRAAAQQDRPAEVVATLDGDGHAAMVQRNWVKQPDGTQRLVYLVTLVRLSSDLIAEVWSFLSDQPVADALWREREDRGLY